MSTRTNRRDVLRRENSELFSRNRFVVNLKNSHETPSHPQQAEPNVFVEQRPAQDRRHGLLRLLIAAVIVSAVFIASLRTVICVIVRNEFRRAFIDDDYGMSGMVDSLIVKRSKDFVAMYDFAQFHSGASIETSLTTNNPKRKKMRHSLKELSWDLPPGAALLPGLGLGNCWVLEGGAGLIGIRLSSQTCISHVTVEHIPAELSIDISTAPRQMRLWGFLRMLADTDAAITVNKTGNYPHSRPPLLAAYEARNGGLFALLGEFEYNVTSPLYIQTFTTLNLDSESTTFEVVVLEVLTNWGNDHTCLYRVRIHCPDR